MNNNILYQDDFITITEQKIISPRTTIHLEDIHNVHIQQTRDRASMYKALLQSAAWGLCCILLTLISIPAFVTFMLGGLGIWWFTMNAWPYAIVVDVSEGERTILQLRDKVRVEKVARILCKQLGLKAPSIEIKIQG